MMNVLPGQGTTVPIGPRFPSSTGSDFGPILPADALVPTRDESQLPVDIASERLSDSIPNPVSVDFYLLSMIDVIDRMDIGREGRKGTPVTVTGFTCSQFLLIYTSVHLIGYYLGKYLLQVSRYERCTASYANGRRPV